MSEASEATVTHQAHDTGRQIKEYFHQVKLEKLQLLHDKEKIGARNQNLEQEQVQKDTGNQSSPSNYNNNDDDDDIDFIINTDRDMFESLGTNDSEIVNSVLNDIEDDEEEEYYPPNEFKETSELFK